MQDNNTNCTLSGIGGFMNNTKIVIKDGKVGEGIKFERVRRITGYLVGTLDRFNDGKSAEVKDRLKHNIRSRYEE